MTDDRNPQSSQRLRSFVGSLSKLIDGNPSEAEILEEGSALLATLVMHDDWLPAAYAQPDPARYQQYLLHCDGAERFCVVSFVWGPGQQTPIHDHQVWGLIGMLRGEELAQRYVLRDGVPALEGSEVRLRPGDTEVLSPAAGDIHRVRNGRDDQVSISIHVYGGNIGAIRRAVYGIDGEVKPFISGYANQTLPNIWGA